MNKHKKKFKKVVKYEWDVGLSNPIVINGKWALIFHPFNLIWEALTCLLLYPYYLLGIFKEGREVYWEEIEDE